ncbi:MAG: phosphate propanoyltransferase [Patescibacteria group bacterium]
MIKIPVEVSARHVHLTQHDLEVLFGEDFVLPKAKELSQTGEFASTEVVALVGAKNKIENVRVLGPCRTFTQIEVSRTDCFFLGNQAPLRLSGKVIRSGAIKIIGPKGELDLTEGLIVAKRHLHVNPDEARDLGVLNNQNIKILVDGPRQTIFGEVEVRVNENFNMNVHLDTDEANAAGVVGDTYCEIIK